MLSCKLFTFVCILFVISSGLLMETWCSVFYFKSFFNFFFIVMTIKAKSLWYFLSFIVHLFLPMPPISSNNNFLAAGFLLLSTTGFFKSLNVATTLRLSVFYPVPWIHLCHQSQNEIHIWVNYLQWIYLSLLFAEIWIYFEAIPFFFLGFLENETKKCLF